MAKGATIFEADINIADMDREYYADHALTLACHPSETPERMMVRLLAFALFASDSLAFGGGVSTQGEPDLWDRDLTGAITRWLELGHPDERDVRRACGKAKQVGVVCYGGRASNAWWTQNHTQLEQLPNLSVILVPNAATQTLGRLAQRTMRWQCNIQDEVVSMISGDELVQIELEILCGARR